MKMIEIRRMEIVINKCDYKGMITSETKLIPLTESDFNKIINDNSDWRKIAMSYLDRNFIISSGVLMDNGLKYYDYKTNSTCCVHLLSLTKKYI